jgi:hypothetical protein
MARCVWVLTADDIVEHISGSTEPSARNWLFAMMETMKTEDLTRMLVTLWAIWHAKRKAIHEDIYQSPISTIMFVDRFIDDLEMGTGNTLKRGGRQPAAACKPRWLAPPVGCTKVNVDVAVARSGARGAMAAVCRSRDGVFAGASALVYDGITHPGTLEALACRKALDIADDLMLGLVHVASDCLEVVRGLYSENLGIFGSILSEIKERSRFREGTNFIHERREFNFEAHNLAKMASTLPVGRHVWLLAPPDGLNMPVILDFE